MISMTPDPVPGSAYQYEVTNETGISIEADQKDVINESRSEVAMNYSIVKDSVVNFIFTTTYDKILIRTKTNDNETVADADKASGSFDPVERMLGILKSARIDATVTPQGVVRHVAGFKELEEKLMANFPSDEHFSRNMAKAQWEKIVGNGLVKNTMNQLFRIFPDSAIHIGDTWKLDSRQEGELPLNIKATYTLKAINNDIAIISSEGVLATDARTNLLGMTGATGDLKGQQRGEFEIETKTGMMINSKITASLEGDLRVMGKIMPVKIKSSVKMTGRRK